MMAGKGTDFGKLVKVALHSKDLGGFSLGNDWSTGALLVVSVKPGSEMEAVGLAAGDKVSSSFLSSHKGKSEEGHGKQRSFFLFFSSIISR